MKKLFKLFIVYGFLAFRSAKKGVHKLLKKDKIINAYRYYSMKTGKSRYESKIFVDDYHSKHFLNKT